MGKIYYIVGKSSSGKDTIYKRLLEEERLDLKPVVRYTTRPIRKGEQNGVEYFFVTKEKMSEYENNGCIIESKGFLTVHGMWYYFTADDGQIAKGEQNYLMIGTIESYQKTRDYYGIDMVEALYIEVENGLRLERAIARERKQENPNYAEICRRFLADEEDFSEEMIKRMGIEIRYNNTQLEDCLKRICTRVEP